MHNKKMKKLPAVLALLSHSVGAADTYTIDPTHTYPSFEIGHMGFSIQRGFFGKTRGNIIIDWENKTGSIDVEIDAASIYTGDATRDENLRSENFFDVANYPTITYKSSQFEFQDNRLVRVKGELSIRGIGNPVELTISHFECGFNLLKLAYGCGADAITAIQRSDYAIVSFLPPVGDQVWLRIQVEAYK
jgi:polyisoprenoid-binding protein YceI